MLDIPIPIASLDPSILNSLLFQAMTHFIIRVTSALVVRLRQWSSIKLCVCVCTCKPEIGYIQTIISLKMEKAKHIRARAWTQRFMEQVKKASGKPICHVPPCSFDITSAETVKMNHQKVVRERFFSFEEENSSDVI